uniref:hypothetical protein n=1 Tax=Mycobacterium avium TaxID=1764 RepID=UPI000ABDDB1B
MAATALAIGGLGLAGLGIATQAQAHPGPFPQWCPGEFWDPGWGNNWDWNNCHDWRGGPGGPGGGGGGPPRQAWEVFQSQLFPQPGSQKLPGHHCGKGPGWAWACVAMPKPA